MGWHSQLFFPVHREVGGQFQGNLVQADREGYVNQWGLSRKNIFASVKASLERLGVDYIDLYQCSFGLSFPFMLLIHRHTRSSLRSQHTH